MRTLLLTLTTCLFVLPAHARYSGGSGTAQDPYQIATAADLIALGETATDYDKHFLLTADIDLDPNLPGRKVFDKAVIAPGWQTPFTGVFDGCGHVIAHLTIIGGRQNLGLFGQSGAYVKNLGVVDVNVIGSGSYVGGLVGHNGGSVTDCYTMGVVSVEDGLGVGGLVGANSGDVTHCYSTAVVSGTDEVGGLVGSNDGAVTQCYSTGLVRSDTSIGVGALVGSGPATRVTSSFWDIQTSGQTKSAGGTGKTTAEMQTASTFIGAGWDFVDETANGSEDIWKIAEGLGYPRLSWEKYSGGTGQPNDPYQIATAADLIALGETPADYDKHFILTADIDLDPSLPGRKVFDKAVIAPDTDPVQNDFQGPPFSGVFDGGSHRIAHLKITGASYLGLFGRLESRTYGKTCVKDLGLVDVNIVGSGSLIGTLAVENVSKVARCYSTGSVTGGGDDVGGLVAGNWVGGFLTACHTTASVTESARYVGGLVGSNQGAITACHATGPVAGKDCVGGLAGFNSGHVTKSHATGDVRCSSWRVGGLVGINFEWGVLRACYASGSVTGGSEAGGLVGYLGWCFGGLHDCYATGSVSGRDLVGGLVGYISSDSAATLRRCFAVGLVTGSGGPLGGLVAGAAKDATDHCFWDIQTSGQIGSQGGAGKITAEMQTAKTFLDAGWDFVGETNNGIEDIWWILEGKDYPRLWWELTEPARP